MPASLWDDVARACRRICVLREQGEPAAAESVRTDELAPSVAALRGTTDDDVDARVAEILAAEQERVADAAVLAALLAPMLERSFRRTGAITAVAGDAGEAKPAPSPQATATPAAAAMPMRRPAGDLADFIDEMLAQERSAPPMRRAS